MVVARNVRSSSVDCVRTDDTAGMNSAIGHLTALGHQRIAYLDGGSTPGGPERLRALKTAAAAHGLGDTVRVLSGGPGEEDGAAATHQLLTEPAAVTAVIAFNDRCARRRHRHSCSRRNLRATGQMSVVGYDNSRIARISYVNLTTVAQDPLLLTGLAVRRAIARLENEPSDPRDQVVGAELIVRTTTGPASL